MTPEILRLMAELDERMRAEPQPMPPALRLAFDGSLSDGELQILDQETFEDRA